ncbi:ATP-binding protein [Lacrimispora saccharolytica]|uniref:Ferredoxin n=1 Tax=Lacrimispora saccharolytica (strain ATCC 35040 / DSM 2544 / NRCC 2533 / WM1) TaxID=610130 RepID=D9R3P0_LACSW|nr:4Fe-4S dicluster domain-containing protein [Lacrimispora saccharolytica]ADL06761.1 putative ferredoxin [[Clostridium] saccharolyticum WM1]QRV19173.1 4Fe-4S dicluster domain-containing protein [Lacrimispora saccharolytica]
MNKPKRIARIGKECVACGSCVTTCPKGAIAIASGVTARIDKDRCIGCGKCARICPADVITIEERRAAV